jgi:hypothetical protein
MAFYRKIADLVEKHGDRAYQAVAEAIAQLVGTRSPTYYFAKIIVLKSRDLGWWAQKLAQLAVDVIPQTGDVIPWSNQVITWSVPGATAPLYGATATVHAAPSSVHAIACLVRAITCLVYGIRGTVCGIRSSVSSHQGAAGMAAERPIPIRDTQLATCLVEENAFRVPRCGVNAISNLMPALPIYMDNHATTRTDPRVVAAMLPYFTEQFGNPASKMHSFGQAAEEAVKQARQEVAAIIGAQPREMIFTSGATESNNLAIKGIAHAYQHKGKHIVTLQTEHKSVLDACAHLQREGFEITYVPVQSNGLLDLKTLEEALRVDTSGHDPGFDLAGQQ